MQNGIELIAAERARQINSEGWTLGHDDEHCDGELPSAAACYALHAAGFRDVEEFEAWHNDGDDRRVWPFGMAWWKPGDPIRDLAKAGALIAAEIDRRQRIA